MIRPAMKNLKVIGKHLTGLEIRNKHNDITYLITEYNKSNMTLYKRYININFEHIDKVFSDYDFFIPQKEIDNKYLIALLHEVAHYKQSKKMTLQQWLKGSEDFFLCFKREDVANRYARRYYKRFINERG